jgi:hypothetical protein
MKYLIQNKLSSTARRLERLVSIKDLIEPKNGDFAMLFASTMKQIHK